MDDSRKVKYKRSQLNSNKILPSATHTKLLAFVAKDLRSKQYQFPLVGKYIDVAKPESLYSKNNAKLYLKVRVCEII